MVILRKFFRLPAVLLLMLLPLFAGASQARELNRQLATDLARAYGYVIGQNGSLDKIARDFPDLGPSADNARRRFAAKFGDSERQLADLLKSILGADFTEHESKMRQEILSNIGKQKLTREVAATFIGSVEARSRGEVPDEFLKPLLIARYADRPATAEFLDGWRQTFETDGGGKSRGLKVHLQLPKSFGSKESPRPHIVRNWTSQDGKGPLTVVLDIRETGAVVTQKDLDDEIASGMMKEIAGPGGQVLNSGQFKHETYPAYWVQIVRDAERATMKFQIVQQYYQIFAKDKAVSLACMSPLDEGAGQNPKAALEEIQPLCMQILNTLVLPQAYE